MNCHNCNKNMKATIAKDYHYTMSGLDNVYLSGMSVYKCTCGEIMVEVPNTEELHTLIAGELLRKPDLLKGKEIRFLRKQMKLKSTQLANKLAVTQITCSRWENDKESIGRANDKLLRLTFLHNFINNIIKNRCISPEHMMGYIKLGNDITTMIHKLRSEKSKIRISEADLQKRTEEELLLTPV